MTEAGTAPDAAAVHAERRRLARELHGGLVQQVTALSLAIDSALLHARDGRTGEVHAALRRARLMADTTVADCRALLDRLGDAGDA